MKRNQHFVLALASLIALGAASPACAGLFTGYFDTGLWTLDDYSNNGGTYKWTGSSVLEIKGTSKNTDPGITYMDLLQYNGLSTYVDFSWALAAHDNTGTSGWCYVQTPGDAAVEYGLPGSGSRSDVWVPSGSHIWFELRTTWNGDPEGKGPATLTITGVPEAGTWLAGVFALGIVACEGLRRKWRVPAAPVLT